MKINSIPQVLLINSKLSCLGTKYSVNEQSEYRNSKYSYNPVAYRDYDVNFMARLFRTPANFYEQEFNKNGMPKTMKNYLEADFEDRQNMPPAQMMRLVFGDINLNEVKSLEQVKAIYPNEPLFNNLRDVPNRNSRTGVIAEIDLMREDNKSLFKNGQDNLGLYLLRKIYLEGKTLKEINKDFQKDISVYYKGLSPIKYVTLSAYGIKFPNNAFWKSFTATRQDFPYEYKPRKSFVSESVLHNLSPKKHSTEIHKIDKKFGKVKDWEIDKIANAMILGIGSEEETRKHIKKYNIQDKESLNFVAKYMSEINSVVLEKVHASDEMKEFYENFDNLSNSQRNIFRAYWNSNPQIKENRSLVMKDTIKLFMDLYGVDGNNEEFKALLDYAHGIKPARLEQQKIHDQIQAEYDEMFAKLGLVDDIDNNIDNEMLKENELSEIKSHKKLDPYTIIPEKHEIVYNGDLDSDFSNLLKEQMKFIPEAFSMRYSKYFLTSPSVTDKYKLSALIGADLPEEYKDLVYSEKEFYDISLNINRSFTLKYPKVIAACNQAMFDLLAEVDPEKAFHIETLDTDVLAKAISTSLGDDLSPKQAKELNNDYLAYLRPITSKEEINKINDIITDFVVNSDSNLIYDNPELSPLVKLLRANIKTNPKLRKDFVKLLKYSNFIENYGASARVLLKNGISDDVKNAKIELMIGDLMLIGSEAAIVDILSDNLYNLETIMKPANSELYYLLKQKYYNKIR